MLRVLTVIAFATSIFAACGGSMSGKLGNAACETGCDEAKSACVDECAEDADPTACQIACDEARSKCASDCKK